MHEASTVVNITKNTTDIMYLLTEEQNTSKAVLSKTKISEMNSL